MKDRRTYLHILMHIGRLLERRVTEQLRGLGLHHGQARLLAILLDHGDSIQAELASKMAIRPATLTRMLKPLKAGHFVRTSTDPNTNRGICVSLTTKGKTAAQKARKAWASVEKELTASVDTEAREDILLALEQFRRALGGEAPESPPGRD